MEELQEAIDRGLVLDYGDSLHATPELDLEMPVLAVAFREAQLEEAFKTVSQLIEKGYVEIDGMDEDGNFTFVMTEAGRVVAEELEASGFEG